MSFGNLYPMIDQVSKEAIQNPIQIAFDKCYICVNKLSIERYQEYKHSKPKNTRIFYVHIVTIFID